MVALCGDDENGGYDDDVGTWTEWSTPHALAICWQGFFMSNARVSGTGTSM